MRCSAADEVYSHKLMQRKTFHGFQEKPSKFSGKQVCVGSGPMSSPQFLINMETGAFFAEFISSSLAAWKKCTLQGCSKIFDIWGELVKPIILLSECESFLWDQSQIETSNRTAAFSLFKPPPPLTKNHLLDGIRQAGKSVITAGKRGWIDFLQTLEYSSVIQVRS